MICRFRCEGMVRCQGVFSKLIVVMVVMVVAAGRQEARDNFTGGRKHAVGGRLKFV